jgi:hypothetical protein
MYAMPPLPVDQSPEPVAVTADPPLVDAEVNPFEKRSRVRELLAKIKKPKREFVMRSAVAAFAAVVGWGIGAKPWKPAPAPRVVVAAAKAPAAKSGNKAARPGAAQPANRRVANVARAAAPTTQKARSVAKPNSVATKPQAAAAKSATAKSAPKPGTPGNKTKAPGTAASKEKSKNVAKATAKVGSKPVAKAKLKPKADSAKSEK